MLKVYADHAATTPMSRKAIEAMAPYLDKIYGNPSSLYSLGQEAAHAISGARDILAGFLGCQSREITFTSGGSEADTQAILSAAALGEKTGKKHIITTPIEHHAVLNTLKALEARGFQITLVGVDESGLVSPDDIARAMGADTCLVTVSYANNEIGTIQPVGEIGALCREKGILFHTDAVQAAGHVPIDVQAQCIDLLSLSAHKFNGPKGVGALYARREIPLVSLIYGGAQERGRRAGTENVPGIVGMAAAFEEACRHMDENAQKVTAMRDRLMDGLEKIPHGVLNGHRVKRLPGNVHYCFEGIEGEALLLLLDQRGIAASSGSACSSGSLDPSHVLLALGRPHEVALGALRLTLSHLNTDAEVDYLLETVPQVIAYMRECSPAWKDLTEGKKPFQL